ncbi:DUF6924 domain-containing protein [Streptomyces sp. NPDC057798]|uniref:DUF6924 domain-containing protein n=1 Tax=Streptomyces sp. NPDC057798 TaxID=3346252 RepID=UPI0036ABDC0E
MSSKVHPGGCQIAAPARQPAAGTTSGPPRHRSSPIRPSSVPCETKSHPLLTVTTLTREECVDEEDYEQPTECGSDFRVLPARLHEVHANLSIGNLGFEEFAAWAHDDSEGIFRSFCTGSRNCGQSHIRRAPSLRYCTIIWHRTRASGTLVDLVAADSMPCPDSVAAGRARDTSRARARPVSVQVNEPGRMRPEC